MMPSIEQLNDYSKIDAVKEIRKSLIEEGAEDPVASQIYEVFKDTDHSLQDKKRDMQYLYQTVTNIRAAERGGEAPRRGPGRPPARTQDRLPVATAQRAADPPNKADEQLDAKITLAHVREVQALIPDNMTLAEFSSFLREMDRVQQEVGGVPAMRHIAAWLVHQKK